MNPRLGLVAALLLFASLCAWILANAYRQHRDTFLMGVPPIDVQTALFPQRLPLSQMHPPAIRPSDPLRYGGTTSSASVIEFGDFDCENCRTMRGVIQTVLPQYHGRVRFVWRDLPVVDVNPKAMDAAVFARCAGYQGRFWETYDALYDAEIPKTENAFARIMRTLKLDQQQMAACRNAKDVKDAIQADVDAARNDGVDSAPFFFVGTKAIRGPMDAATLKKEIDLFLAS